MKIQVKLQAYKSTHAPYVKLSVNGIEYCNQQFENIVTFIEFEIDPIESNILEIQHYNKSNSDTQCNEHGTIVADCAIELLTLSIDGFIIPKNILFKKPFYVQWPDNLIEEARISKHELPESINNNLFFGFNGRYQFDFQQNFPKEYYWYYWQMERDANQNLQMVDESTNTGYFEAYGLKLAINQDFNYTISDLKYIIDNHAMPGNMTKTN